MRSFFGENTPNTVDTAEKGTDAPGASPPGTPEWRTHWQSCFDVAEKGWVDLGRNGWILVVWVELGGIGWICVELGRIEWIWVDLGRNGWI